CSPMASAPPQWRAGASPMARNIFASSSRTSPSHGWHCSARGSAPRLAFDRRLPLGLFAKPEVAARGAFHDRLRPRQLEIRAEAGDHGMVAAAVDERAELGEAELLVELCVAAARHVEVETFFVMAGLRPADEIDLHATAPGPE